MQGLSQDRIAELQDDLGHASDEEIGDDVGWSQDFCPLDDEDDGLTEDLFKTKQNSSLTNGTINYAEIIETALDAELKLSSTLNGGDVNYIRNACRELTMSMEQRILHAIMHGNLAFLSKKDKAVRKMLKKLWQRRATQPSVYCQLLVNSKGLSPSPNQLRTVIERVHEYLSFSESSRLFAGKVDNRRGKWSWTETNNDRRKYLLSRTRDELSMDRVREIQAFCTNLTKRLDSIPREQWDDPLEKPLAEFGYTMNADNRLHGNLWASLKS